VKDEEKYRRVPIWGTTPALAWRAWGKRKNSQSDEPVSPSGPKPGTFCTKTTTTTAVTIAECFCLGYILASRSWFENSLPWLWDKYFQLFFGKLLQFEANYSKCIGKFPAEKVTTLEPSIEDPKKDHKSGMSKKNQRQDNLNRISLYVKALNTFLRLRSAVNSLLLSLAYICNHLLHSYVNRLWPAWVHSDTSKAGRMNM